MSVTSRRRFLGWGAAGAGSMAVMGGLGALLEGLEGPPAGGSAAGPGSGPSVPAPTDRRVLVVVELEGGNDGLSTVVPVEDGAYHDLRPTVALDGDDVVPWTDGWALHYHLAPLAPRGLAALHGVGSHQPDLSHFEMQARWWAGRPEGGDPGTGFLGRLCDRLGGPPDDPDAPLLVGVSVGAAPSAALRSEQSPTASMAGPDGLGLLAGDDEAARSARRCLERLAGWGPGDEVLGAPRRGLAGVLRIADLLAGLDPVPEERFGGHDFARQLGFAAQLVAADAGVRVVHVPMAGGAFDTHTGHRDAHERNMELLGTGLVAFLDHLDQLGLADRVLVATTSEFGRRADEHDGGLDHGTASTALVCGPVVTGAHGEPPSLRHLDDDGNLRATVGFDRYQATMAAWLGIDPAEVLGDGVEAVEGLLLD